MKQLFVGSVIGASIVVVAACGAPAEQAPFVAASVPAWSGSVSYSLGPNVATLYPNASWLPVPYQPKYPTAGDAITRFTQQSLQRDGITFTSVSATNDGTVTITGADARAGQYAQIHSALLDANHAMQGFNGVALCRQTAGCWDPHSQAGQPWAFFLPLGMPLVNQQSVSLLDYPPATSLLTGDYLENFTMQRWSRVLAAAGVGDPVLYETIVDTRPIAAPGSGQSSYLPDPGRYFNAAGSNRFYITPMLTLLTDPPSNDSTTNTVPIQVLGGPAQKVWSAIIGSAVSPLSVGSTTLPGATKATAWVAGNHPDVTTYQCCSGDKNSRCYDQSTKSWSEALIADEQIDLQVACIIQKLAQNQGISPATAASSCNTEWGGDPGKLPPANARTLCVQAKLDNQDSGARCASAAAAENYCAAHDNNACFDFTCSVPSATPVPPKR